jgi:pyruvate dehydrogenase E2 component (dihydrolipoamide acetyltransferase)
VGAIRSRLVLEDKAADAEHPVLHATPSADHRIVDGAMAARLLRDLRERLEDPALLLS